MDLRNSLLPLAELPRLLDHLKEAHHLAVGLGDQRRSCQLASLMALALFFNGDSQGAVNSAHFALELARGLGDPALAIPARVYLGYGYYGLGDYRGAVDCLRQNIAALREEPEGERFGIAVPPSILTRYCMVLCLSELGEFSEAQLVADEALGIADTVREPFGLTQANWAAGYLYLGRGEARRAVAAFERTQQLCQEWNVLFMAPIVPAFLGAAYLLLDRFDKGLALIEQALRDAGQKGLRASPWLKAGWLSEAYLLSGRRSEARELTLQTLHLAIENRRRGDQAWLLRLLAEIARRADAPELDTACARYRDALAVAAELGMRPVQAHCHLGLGMLHSDARDLNRSREHLLEAETMYREMGMQFWLEKAELALKEL
jgi:tetratricopeptide (TPR) repeat protein